MNRETVMWLTIAIYIVFIAAVAIINNKSTKNITELTIGGRNAGAWVSALSYGTAYFSAVMFIGYAGGTGWKYGFWAVLPGIGNAIFGSLFAWLVLAKKTRALTRKHQIKTMPQLFEKRFDSPAMRLFCSIVIFIFLIPYSASVYKGLTSVCSVLLGVDEKMCMLVIAIASILLVTLGGYVATLKADFIQGIIMLVGVLTLIIAVIRCEQVGGISKGFTAITVVTAKLNLTPKDHIMLWSTVLMTSFGTWGLPQMIHKYYGIKDNKEVTRGTIISTVFALVVAGGGYLIGSLSHLFFTELPAGGPDYLVPNMLSAANLSSILLGVVLMLLIAASVSTLCAITITASSTLSIDLVQNKIKPDMSDKTSAIFMKVAAFCFVVLSYLVANSTTPILDMMSYSWGVISGSFLAPYVLLLVYKKINKTGAWIGMIGGFFTALPPAICKLFAPNVELPFFGKVADLGPLFACVAMVISMFLCLVGSALAKEAEVNHEFYLGDVVNV